jgi:dinuclear metal center YbgI/SA1388 family protein
MGSPTLAEVVAAFDRRYPRSLAEPWDAVGLVCGDPDRPVRRIHFAVDPVGAVVAEALAAESDLLVTHHPLLLRPVSAIHAGEPKGRVLHRLIEGRCALFTAHTNADRASPGVSDALARALGLTDLRPLEPVPEPDTDLHVALVPLEAVDRVVDAMASAGAGVIGNYARCYWGVDGVGSFEPLAGATPTIGTPGSTEQVPERRIEMVAPLHRRAAVTAALVASHPYEEPAFHVLPRAADAGERGLGRIGVLPVDESLSEFAARVARALPVGGSGIRVAGAKDRRVRTVAVCGGAGDSLLDTVAETAADVYVTGDLRHHRAGEFLEAVGPDGPALIDATHFGTEHPWLAQAAALLLADLDAAGATVEVAVSSAVTDPWSFHAVPEGSPR